MNTVAENKISKAKQIFQTGKPNFVLFVRSHWHIIRQCFQRRVRILLFRDRRIRHDRAARIQRHPITGTEILIYGCFDPQEGTATAAHSMIHIEVDTAILILNAARLIINRLGKQIGFLRRNRADGNGSRIGNQIDAALFIDMNLLGIIRKAAKRFFRCRSQNIGRNRFFHNHFNSNIKGYKTAGFMQKIGIRRIFHYTPQTYGFMFRLYAFPGKSFTSYSITSLPLMW